MDTLRLEDTASLVMTWALPLYRRGIAKQFVEHYEFNRGDALIRRCNQVCTWYDQVILNRKNFIRYQASQWLHESNRPQQVVIPAAGATPLALELMESYEDRISRVIEIDLRGMATKRQIYREIAPQWCDKLFCLRADLTLPETLPRLVEHCGWQENEPTIILVEGISYYLMKNELGDMLRPFRSPEGSNRVLIEYLLRESCVRFDRRSIPAEVFRAVKEYAGLWLHQPYTPRELEDLLKTLGGRVEAHYFLPEMERLRTGVNAYFLENEDGWIGCAAGRL